MGLTAENVGGAEGIYCRGFTQIIGHRLRSAGNL